MKNDCYNSKYNYVNLWGEFAIKYKYNYSYNDRQFQEIVMCCPTTHNDFIFEVRTMDKKHNIVYKLTNL